MSDKHKRTPILAGNWKMNPGTVKAAAALAEALVAKVEGVTGVEAVLAPPFVALSTVARIVQGTNVSLAAQNVYWEASGAYTAEISCEMLKDVGCTYCIVGHSERRQLFGETDAAVNKRTQALLSAGIRPIVCVGETLGEREEGITFKVLQTQLQGGLAGFGAADLTQMVIAYEPVWAIGTGRNATPGQAEEAHAFLRRCLQDWYGGPAAEGVRIQYGGSVKANNIDGLMAQENIDGALVGGASLDAESFARIVRFRSEEKE